MKQIVLVTHFYPAHLGGIEVIASELATRLAKRGFQLTWIAAGPAPRDSVDGVQYLPMRAVNFTDNLFGFPYPLVGPVALIRLCEAIRRSDLVWLHDSLYVATAVAAGWSRLIGKPYCVTQHIGMIPYSQRIFRALMSAANRTVGHAVLAGAARGVFYSRVVQDYFSRFIPFRERAAFVPNGVDTSVFTALDPEARRRLRRDLGWPQDRRVLLFVGRFIERKGLKLLRTLALQFGQFAWKFAGSGPEDPALWNFPSVESLGRRSHAELARCYQAADLLVLPSVGEGFPLVVQESMACGTPALISADTARAIPGIEEVCFVSDLTVEHLVAALQRIMDSPEERESMRSRVAAHAQAHWNWDACADRYRELFDGILRESVK